MSIVNKIMYILGLERWIVLRVAPNEATMKNIAVCRTFQEAMGEYPDALLVPDENALKQLSIENSGNIDEEAKVQPVSYRANNQIPPENNIKYLDWSDIKPAVSDALHCYLIDAVHISDNPRFILKCYGQYSVEYSIGEVVELPKCNKLEGRIIDIVKGKTVHGNEYKHTLLFIEIEIWKYRSAYWGWSIGSDGLG